MIKNQKPRIVERRVNRMNDDLISRQAAIDSLLEALYDLDEYDFVDKVFNGK